MQLQWDLERAAMESASEESSSIEDEINDLGKKSKKKKSKETAEPVEETVDLFGDSTMVGANTDIYAAKVTMILGGDRKNLEKFLEEIMNSDKEILITSFSWSKYQVQRAKDGVIISEKNKDKLKADDYELVEMDALTITMEIYMCDKNKGKITEEETE